MVDVVAVVVDDFFSRGDLSDDSILFFFAIAEFWYSSMHCKSNRARMRREESSGEVREMFFV